MYFEKIRITGTRVAPPATPLTKVYLAVMILWWSHTCQYYVPYKMGTASTSSSSLLPFTMSSSNDGAPSPSQDLKTSLTGSDHGLIAAETIVQTPARPPIVYSSPKAFARSFAARWKSIWTRAFILSLLAGQVASLCITCTNITTTELVNRGWTLSTTQGIFLYVIYQN